MSAFVFPGRAARKSAWAWSWPRPAPPRARCSRKSTTRSAQKLFAIMREGPEDQLTLTENAQPAIMAHAIAVLRVLEKEGGMALDRRRPTASPATAWANIPRCAPRARSAWPTPRGCCRLRGQAMQAAVPVGVGAMCALLGADLDKAQALAEAAAEGQVCQVANDNDPGQVVLSGHREAIERAIGAGQGARHQARRAAARLGAVPLRADAARRRRDGRGAGEDSAARLPRCRFSPTSPPATVTDPAEEQRLLVEQVTGRVRWRESVLAMQRRRSGGVRRDWAARCSAR